MPDLTPTTEDYVKVIWGAGEWADTPVTIKSLTEKMSVSASTVSEAIKRLAHLGLVEHPPYGSIVLTEAGRSEALQVVRRHRLIEAFLSDQLGYKWHEVHAEAEVLEHAVSDKLIERIDQLLGRPTRDPHGDPIPTEDGRIPELSAVQLTDVDGEGMWAVARVSDRDPEILRYLESMQIGLDTVVRVVEKRVFAGTLTLEAGGHTLVMGFPVAQAIWVTAV